MKDGTQYLREVTTYSKHKAEGGCAPAKDSAVTEGALPVVAAGLPLLHAALQPLRVEVLAALCRRHVWRAHEQQHTLHTSFRDVNQKPGKMIDVFGCVYLFA